MRDVRMAGGPKALQILFLKIPPCPSMIVLWLGRLRYFYMFVGGAGVEGRSSQLVNSTRALGLPFAAES